METQLIKYLLVLFLFAATFVPTSLAHASVDDGYDRKMQALETHISEAYKLDKTYVQQLVATVQKYSERTGFPTMFDVLAVIAVESSFNKKASSRTGKGLMQVNPLVHKVQGSLFDPETNIQKGVELLSKYYDGNSERTLVKYNAGPGGAAAICKRSRKCETKYSRKVLRAKKELLSAMSQLK